MHRFGSETTRATARRRQHEQEASICNPSILNSEKPLDEGAWQYVAPLLDEALDKLGETGSAGPCSCAFSSSKAWPKSAQPLALNEEAARKRSPAPWKNCENFSSNSNVTIDCDDAWRGDDGQKLRPIRPGPGLSAMAAVAAVKGSAVTAYHFNPRKRSIENYGRIKTSTAIAVACRGRFDDQHFRGSHPEESPSSKARQKTNGSKALSITGMTHKANAGWRWAPQASKC